MGAASVARSAGPQQSAGTNCQNYNVSGASTGQLRAQHRRTRCDFDDCGPRTVADGAPATLATSSTRGYRKIEGAARAFDFDFRGRTVLDIGSSTGGFTEYALERGASHVIAVEKGSHQMKAPLRFDPRVTLHEKTDIFDFHPAERPDIIVADVSFIPLTKVLMYAKLELARSDTQFLVMLKPQFEGRPSTLHKGVVKNERFRRQIIKDFEQWLKTHGFLIINKRDNQLQGKTGNLERFYHLALAK